MTDETLTLSLLGYTQAEALNIESILSLAERRLSKRWHIARDKYAKFCMAPEKLKADLPLENFPPERRILTVKLGDAVIGESPRLSVDERCMPHLTDLVALLNRLGEGITDGQTGAVPALPPTGRAGANAVALDNAQQEAVPKMANDRVFDPGQGFLGQLLARQNQRCLLVFKLRRQPATPLYVCPARQTYYSAAALDSLRAYFTATDEELSLNIEAEPDTEALLRLLASEALAPYPLPNLIWYAAFTVSGGRPMLGSNAQDIVQLNRWPDNTLPGCREMMKLSAFMRGNATTLQGCASALAMPIGQAHDFYNACKLVGWATQETETALRQPSPPPKNAALFAKIKARLDQDIADSNATNH